MERFATDAGLLPEQIRDAPDPPDAHMRFGGPTGSATPLIWAHAEYVKLLRSVSDGEIFDHVPAVAERYLSNRRPPPIEVWSFRRRAPIRFTFQWADADRYKSPGRRSRHSSRIRTGMASGIAHFPEDEMPNQFLTDAGRKPLAPEEFEKYEGYVAEILDRLGMDLESEACRTTPRRWLKSIVEMTRGYDGDAGIGVTFERECAGCDENRPTVQIVEGPISFASLCEHHVLPFIGHAWIGCLRHEKIIGLSKFTRIVRKRARRFTVQERIAQEIALELESLLNPHGVIVLLHAHHACTRCRGVREATASTRTIEKRGHYVSNHDLVTEFMALAGLDRRSVVRMLLHEGGPIIFGEYLAARTVDELFLTVAPRVAGRPEAEPRPGFAGSTSFMPDTAPGFSPRSIRTSDDGLLFLRYVAEREANGAGAAAGETK